MERAASLHLYVFMAIKWLYVALRCPSHGITEGGYIRLSLESVAGTGGIASIELRKSPLAVGAASSGRPHAGCPHRRLSALGRLSD